MVVYDLMPINSPQNMTTSSSKNSCLGWFSFSVIDPNRIYPATGALRNIDAHPQRPSNFYDLDDLAPEDDNRAFVACRVREQVVIREPRRLSAQCAAAGCLSTRPPLWHPPQLRSAEFANACREALSLAGCCEAMLQLPPPEQSVCRLEAPAGA